MKKIQVMVIDDERSCREELKRMLKNYPDVEVIGEARDADEAKALMEIYHPDLIFLDIQMPEKNGFDLLESLDEVPAVLFTTAFSEYAVQAFEINALDYLMKPIREERFAKAMEKVINHISVKDAAGAVLPANRQLFIRGGEKCYFIKQSDIYLIESLDNYSRLCFGEKKVLLKRSLRQWEQLLDANLFFRINRTQMINTSYIQQLYPESKGRLAIRLRTGQLLEVSNRQSVKFKNRNSI